MQWCALPGHPDRSTVHRWVEKDEDFARRFARARDLGWDVIAEETAALAEQRPDMITDAAGNERVDAGYVQWQRLRVDTRLRLLAKWSPKKYGDRVALDHAGGVSINVVTGVPE